MLRHFARAIIYQRADRHLRDLALRSRSWRTVSIAFFKIDFTKKVNVKRERRFDRPTVIFKFMIKSKISMCLYTIVRINEILTKSSKIFT